MILSEHVMMLLWTFITEYWDQWTAPIFGGEVMAFFMFWICAPIITVAIGALLFSYCSSKDKLQWNYDFLETCGWILCFGVITILVIAIAFFFEVMFVIF